MGEEVVGLVQIMGGIAAQCFAPRLIKSNYMKCFDKVCCHEISDVVKEVFKSDENHYTKTVLSYMKTPTEEIETLVEELQRRRVRPEVIQTLNLPKTIELYELIYNSYLKSPLYLIYKDNISEHIKTIKRWLEAKQVEVRTIPKTAMEDPVQEGSKLMDNKEYEKAMQKFKDASKNIKDPSLLANMGNVYFLQGKYKEARDTYLEALKLKPEEPGYYITLGNIYDKLELYDQADQAYKKAMELNRELEEIIYERRFFEFWKNKKITPLQEEHLKTLLQFMSIPGARVEMIEKQVKKSLGIAEEEKKTLPEESEMKVILRIEDGPGGKEDFEFDRHDTFVVGRSQVNTHSQLKGDRYISRHHFILELNPPYCYLKDLGSTNGTKINGKKLEKAELRELSAGDIINVGKTTLKIEIIKGDKDEEEGTLVIKEVHCIECGKDVTEEVADRPPEELEGLIYTCKKCIAKNEERTRRALPLPFLRHDSQWTGPPCLDPRCRPSHAR